MGGQTEEYPVLGSLWDPIINNTITKTFVFCSILSLLDSRNLARILQEDVYSCFFDVSIILKFLPWIYRHNIDWIRQGLDRSKVSKVMDNDGLRSLQPGKASARVWWPRNEGTNVRTHLFFKARIKNLNILFILNLKKYKRNLVRKKPCQLG